MWSATSNEGASMRAHVGPLAFAVALAFGVGMAEAGSVTKEHDADPPWCCRPLTYNWSGIYVGGHVAGAHAQTDWVFTDPLLAPESIDHSEFGFIGGAQAGLQWHWQRLVIGAEVSYSWGSIEDSIGSIVQPGVTLTSEVRNLLLVTGKLGYAFEHMLAYAKGGWASADVDFRSTTTATGALLTSSSGRENGWTAGLGLEYAINHFTTIGIEYDFVHLNVDTRSQLPGTSTAIDAGVDIQTVMARLNFKLGPRAGEYGPLK
jgi:outer membrane immunogenic protein